MGKVIQWNGLTKLKIPPDKILREAVGKLDEVIILGYDKDEEEYYASSYSDGGDIIWLLERAKHILMTNADNTEEE